MGERALEGVSAAPGVASGQALVVDRGRGAATVTVPVERRSDEVLQARAALRESAHELEKLAAGLVDAGRKSEAEIVETGVLMALDPELSARVDTLITEFGLTAEDALREAADQTALELAKLADPMLAQRADDVRSIGRRASAQIAGESRAVPEGVLVADTLGPADVAELAPTAKAIALAGGGVTAHAAIVARSLGLPMVVGLGPGLLEVEDGEEVVVDGDRGIFVRGPAVERVLMARSDAERRQEARVVAVARRLEPAETTDGHRLHVLANASTAAELREATAQGAEGVGLLRSELLFLEATAWPDSEQQVRSLRPVLAQLPDGIATVRLFDFGGDKTPPFLRGTTERGIDLLLDHPEKLREHLRAILTAGRDTALRILVPMVADPSQMQRVRDLLGDEKALLGAMIETPHAAAAAGAIADVADFFSIGTNDLTQLVLGLDRDHSKAAPVLDPRVLGLIAATIRAAHRAQIPVDVCGEAASDAKAMPILIGLGVDELSVAAARVGQVRQAVRELDYADCRRQAEKLLDQAGHASRERV